MDYTSEVAVPSSSISIVAPAEFTSPDIETTSSNRFASEKTTKDLIEEITVSKFTITSLTGNLDYIKSFSVFILADNLPEVLVASKENIPAGSTSVAADLTRADIKQHIFKDKIRLKIKVTASTGIATEQKLKIDQSVTVKGQRI
jgi:hypothetical protein